jgi:hypothetical protein
VHTNNEVAGGVAVIVAVGLLAVVNRVVAGLLRAMDVRLELARLFEGLDPVAGLADHRNVGLGFKQLPQLLADHGMVVGDQNTNPVHPFSLVTSGICARTVVPSAGLETMEKLPPSSAILSRIPRIPYLL